MLRYIHILGIILLGNLCNAQNSDLDFRKDFVIHAAYINEVIQIDGELNESCWAEAQTVSDFKQKRPFYADDADPKTEVKLCFDDDNLYIAAICYQKSPIIIQSRNRDRHWQNDGFAILLDSQNSMTNGYLFGTSAIGAQWEALRSETSGINDAWNNKWYAETNITEEYWSAEMVIPLRILRFEPGVDEWGVNFVRNVISENENHNWTAVPESFWPVNPTFAGTLKWSQAPQPTKGNFNLIPYGKGGISKAIGSDSEYIKDIGLDARTSVNSTLNLDLTFNPDFSQIEADELVTNLTRFNIFLPEKRTFFLENSDLFADYGSGNIRPFFSRKIGLDENFQSVPILYGARLTGNIKQDVRIGVMNIHSRSIDNENGQNQSAVTLKKQFGRSFVQGMFLNRQAFDGTESVENDYGRNASLESLYSTSDGKFGAWVGLHQSYKSGFDNKNGFYSTGFTYRDAKWEVTSDNVMFQENYFADMGFTPRVENYDAERDTTIRVGFNSSYTSIDYRIRPQNSNIIQHNFGVEHLMVFNPDWSYNEQYNRFRYFLTFKNTQAIRIRLNHSFQDLLFPFSFTSAEPLPATTYRTWDLNLEYESDERKDLSWELSSQFGGFYNGTLKRFEVNSKYRVGSWGNFSVGYQLNDIKFPDPYGSAKISAFVAKTEIGFNRNLFWTSLIQYIDQSEFLGVNSRFQWRFAPMSDIFLVYIDNYDVLEQNIGSNLISSNNRALILKLNYWY